MSTHEILVKARSLIANPKKWSKRDSSWRKYCAYRAVEKYCNLNATRRHEAVSALCDAAGLVGPIADVGEWNDDPSRTHAEVLAAFDRAIEATKPTEPKP